MDGLNLCSSESRLDFVILECQLISSFLNAKYHVAVDEGRWVIYYINKLLHHNKYLR